MIVYCTPRPSRYAAKPSKNARRKAARYGIDLASKQQGKIARKIGLVKHGLNVQVRDAMIKAQG